MPWGWPHIGAVNQRKALGSLAKPVEMCMKWPPLLSSMSHLGLREQFSNVRGGVQRRDNEHEPVKYIFLQ